MAKKKTEIAPPEPRNKLGRKPYVTPEMRQNCARAIRQWREEVGRNAGREGPATQQEFAEMLGVRVYDVSDWEQAKRLPGRETAIRIGDVLGVHPRDVTALRAPHLAQSIRLRAFKLKAIDDLSDPAIQAQIEQLVDQYERKNYEKLAGPEQHQPSAPATAKPRKPR